MHTNSSIFATTTAKILINGTAHAALIGEKLVVGRPISTSTTRLESGSPLLPANPEPSDKEASTTAGFPAGASNPENWPSSDNFTIDFNNSHIDVNGQGNLYCGKGYKSFWYNDWETDHSKRHASCDAVAYNQVAYQAKQGQKYLPNTFMFYGPMKDGTNVCYWSFNCPVYNQCSAWPTHPCGQDPQISFENIKDIAQAWYNPINWPAGKAPTACGHIELNSPGNTDQCYLEVSVVAFGTGPLVFGGTTLENSGGGDCC